MIDWGFGNLRQKQAKRRRPALSAFPKSGMRPLSVPAFQFTSSPCRLRPGSERGASGCAWCSSRCLLWCGRTARLPGGRPAISLWVAAAGTFIILAALARMALGMITRWMARREQKRAWKTLAATALVAEALELEKKKMANEADDWDAFDDDVLDDASFAADDGIGWNDEDDDPFLEDDDPLFSDDWRVKEER